MIFDDGSREPLHGHNYRVQFKGEVNELNNDMVFDFLDIKPIIRKVCDGLDHKLLIPKDNPKLKIYPKNKNIEIHTPDGDLFSIPQKDVLLLPILNTSVERMAHYLTGLIREETLSQYGFCFERMELELEETPGQCAVYIHQEESK